MNAQKPKIGNWVTVQNRVGHWKVVAFDPESNEGTLAPEGTVIRLSFGKGPKGWRIHHTLDDGRITFRPNYVPTEGTEGKAARLDALVAMLEGQVTDYSTGGNGVEPLTEVLEVLFFIATGRTFDEAPDEFLTFKQQQEEKHGQ